jgi:hypothetical protein
MVVRSYLPLDFRVSNVSAYFFLEGYCMVQYIGMYMHSAILLLDEWDDWNWMEL